MKPLKKLRIHTKGAIIEAVSGAEIRRVYGWPCFHCGRTIALCRQAGLPGHEMQNGLRRCCRKCKGDASHL